jgi:hypothetical protein
VDLHSGGINEGFQTFKRVWKIWDKVSVGNGRSGKGGTGGKSLAEDLTTGVGARVWKTKTKESMNKWFWQRRESLKQHKRTEKNKIDCKREPKHNELRIEYHATD